MIKVNGQPVIKQIMDRLYLHGITEFIVSVHYLPHIITEGLNSKALYFYESELMSHPSKIKKLREWLQDEDFMVINADTLSNIHYTWMLNQHLKGTITVAMDEWRCIGAWIYPKEYFKDPFVPIHPYRQLGIEWWDIGTPNGLKQARKFYK